jgi:hypothetical protein
VTLQALTNDWWQNIGKKTLGALRQSLANDIATKHDCKIIAHVHTYDGSPQNMQTQQTQCCLAKQVY